MKKQCIILVGIPGSGKSTFFKQNFEDTHVRINLDMIGNRNKERALLIACLVGEISFVVDNTNIKEESRRKYLKLAKEFGFETIIYSFKINKEECLERNSRRKGKKRVPDQAIFAMLGQYKKPEFKEGADKIIGVRNNNDGTFKLGV